MTVRDSFRYEMNVYFGEETANDNMDDMDSAINKAAGTWCVASDISMGLDGDVRDRVYWYMTARERDNAVKRVKRLGWKEVTFLKAKVDVRVCEANGVEYTVTGQLVETDYGPEVSVVFTGPDGTRYRRSESATTEMIAGWFKEQMEEKV